MRKMGKEQGGKSQNTLNRPNGKGWSCEEGERGEEEWMNRKQDSRRGERKGEKPRGVKTRIGTGGNEGRDDE